MNGRPTAPVAFNPELAFVGAHDFVANGESQAVTWKFLAMQPFKGLNNLS